MHSRDTTELFDGRLFLLGLLLLAAVGCLGIAAFRQSFVGMVFAVISYFVCIGLLYKRFAEADAIFVAGLRGASVPGLLVGGLGSLVAFEIARLSGWVIHLGPLEGILALVCGGILGAYLGVALSALMAAGVNRGWMLGLFSWVVPMATYVGRSDSWAVAVPPLWPTAVVLSLFFVFALVAAPRITLAYKSEVSGKQRGQQRDSEEDEDQASSSPDPEDAQRKAQIEEDLHGIGIALSGGGHRATLFGLGVLLYLVRSGAHKSISQISSVSGGSLLSGFLGHRVNLRSCSSTEFDRVAGALAAQIAKRGTLFALPMTMFYLLVLFLSAAVSLAGLALWVRPPTWVPETWLLPFGTLAAIAVFGYIWQWRGELVERALRETLFSVDGRGVRYSETACPPIHVMCATEIQTGSATFFTRFPLSARTEDSRELIYAPAVVADGFQITLTDSDLAKVARASAALPVAFPAVRMPIRGWVGVSLHPINRTWGSFAAPHMLLADGGVRDNLGVEWFDQGLGSQVSELIVVSAAANRVLAQRKRVSIPILGELRSLNLVKEIPYNTREQNRRTELTRRFTPAYEGESERPLGAVLHIEEGPLDLAQALTGTRDLRPSDNWFHTPDSVTIRNAIAKNPDSEAFRSRAEAAIVRIVEAEDVEDLRSRAEAVARKDYAKKLAQVTPADVLVMQEWHARITRSARFPTSLFATDILPATELMRHGFALAMAKLHILRGYPLCEIPSIDELRRLMSKD